jgi:hypothetical protein
MRMFCHAGNDPANPRALRLGVFQDVNAIRQQIPFFKWTLAFWIRTGGAA